MTRRLVLRTMLVGLACSAALGILAIFATSTIAGQMTGTAVLISVAATAMLPFTPRESGAGISAMQRHVLAYIAIALALSLALVWDIRIIATLRTDELTLAWFIVGLPTLLFAMPALRRRERDDRSLRLAERMMTLGAYSTIGATIAAMFLAQITGLGNELGISIGYIALGAVIAMACSAIGLRTPSTDRFTPVPPADGLDRTAAIVGISCALIWFPVAAWAQVTDRHNLAVVGMPQVTPAWAVAIAAGATALSSGIWCLFGLSRVRNASRYLRHIAVAVTLALGAVVAYTVLDSPRMYGASPFLGRLIAALAIVDSAALIAAAALMVLHRGRRIGSEPIDSLDWTCPRCATKATIGVGEHVCSGCALAVTLSFRDDRCPACGYDLRGLAHDHTLCPECGRARQS